jgi:hypothetical protein
MSMVYQMRYPKVFYSDCNLDGVLASRKYWFVGETLNAQQQITGHTPMVVSEMLSCLFM